MSKEQYVTSKVAKLLRKKGFRGDCIAYYNDDGKRYLSLNAELHPLPCPTQQMACRWLRETHKIHIGVYVDEVDKFVAFLDEIPVTGYTSTPIEGFYNSYEDAVEAALEYVLTKLI